MGMQYSRVFTAGMLDELKQSLQFRFLIRRFFPAPYETSGWMYTCFISFLDIRNNNSRVRRTSVAEFRCGETEDKKSAPYWKLGFNAVTGRLCGARLS